MGINAINAICYTNHIFLSTTPQQLILYHTSPHPHIHTTNKTTHSRKTCLIPTAYARLAISITIHMITDHYSINYSTPSTTQPTNYSGKLLQPTETTPITLTTLSTLIVEPEIHSCVQTPFSPGAQTSPWAYG